MKKATVTKVTTRFSERNELHEKEFSSIAEFDLFVVKLYANDGFELASAYDKTDVAIHFDNCDTYNLRWDGCRGETLTTHLMSVFNYHINGECPKYENVSQWQKMRTEYREYLKSHAF